MRDVPGPPPIFVDDIVVSSGSGMVMLTFRSPKAQEPSQPMTLEPSACVAMTEARVRDMLQLVQRHLESKGTARASITPTPN